MEYIDKHWMHKRTLMSADNYNYAGFAVGKVLNNETNEHIGGLLRKGNNGVELSDHLDKGEQAAITFSFRGGELTQSQIQQILETFKANGIKGVVQAPVSEKNNSAENEKSVTFTHITPQDLGNLPRAVTMIESALGKDDKVMAMR